MDVDSTASASHPAGTQVAQTAGKRVALTLVATLAGWLAATLYSLVFEVDVLWRNAPPGGLLLDLLDGVALWSAFTLAVCAGIWCVTVLPVSLFVQAATIVRWRWRLAAALPVLAVLLVGQLLGTWHDLGGNGPSNPVTASLFLEYSGFGFLLALVTTLVYAHLLRSAEVDGLTPAA